MSKQKGIIIGMLALVVTMMVGYAIFSETITINGTATAKGSFDITYECEVVGSGTGTCVIEGQTIKTTSTLNKPTDEVEYRITITNNGTIPAVLKTVDSSNNISGADLNVAGDEMHLDKTTMLGAFYNVCLLDTDGTTCIGPSDTFKGDSQLEGLAYTLQPNRKMYVDISHMWFDSEGILDNQPALPEAGATMNYNVTLGFEQVTN